LVHTERKISIDDFEPEIEKISDHICKEESVMEKPEK
jgi:hypothetical protein